MITPSSWRSWVGVLACAAPARRALRIQPTEALRQPQQFLPPSVGATATSLTTTASSPPIGASGPPVRLPIAVATAGCPPRDVVPVFHDAVLKACRAAGFVPHAPHEADYLHMVLGLVAAGAGVAIVPASARKVQHDQVTYRALHPSPERLETALAWRRDDKSPALAEFIATARRVLNHRHE